MWGLCLALGKQVVASQHHPGLSLDCTILEHSNMFRTMGKEAGRRLLYLENVPSPNLRPLFLYPLPDGLL